ncbi:MAG: hypothetical protein HOW73_39205 [Polyangiaceae bacterium]|nr:hypothetical protein [Polyangiaceae bacterium]
MNKLLLAFAAISAASACASEEPESPPNQSEEAATDAPTVPSTRGPGGTCWAEECFDVTARDMVSFIAVEAQKCERRANVEIELFDDHGHLVTNGLSPMATRVSTCDVPSGIPHFSGLGAKHYRVCVRQEGVGSLGDVRITTRADGQCRVALHEGTCGPCSDGVGGSTGGEGANGQGGSTGGEGANGQGGSTGGEGANGQGGSTGGEGGDGTGGSTGGEGGSPGTAGGCPTG